MSVSEKKLAANRANAKKSTGPRSDEGKRRSSRNAQTHGLFCADLLLHEEDADEFASFRQQLLRSLNPQNVLELMLCDRIVASSWKLRRFGRYERIAHQPPMDQDAPADQAWQASDRLAFMERMSRYEQRLELSIHRNLRALERMRKRTQQDGPEDLPQSPFVATDASDPVPSTDKENEQNEPTAVPDSTVEKPTTNASDRCGSISDGIVPRSDPTRRVSVDVPCTPARCRTASDQGRSRG